ncbi:MAG: DedA family protein [Nanoarchaeota archaeon]
MSQVPLEDNIFEYGLGRHKFKLQIISVILLVIITFGILYGVFYSEISESLIGKFINSIALFIQGIISHVISTMSLIAPTQISLLGVFYVTFFGGLFFLMIPVEISFFGALTNYHPLLVLLVTACGASLSYTIDYLMGKHFSGFFKKTIPLKKFYKTKTTINKYGGWAVLFFNIIGAGSQQTTFMLGVFRYNKIRLLVFAVTGQLIKYVIIVGIYYLAPAQIELFFN